MATTEIGTREMPSGNKPSNVKAIELHDRLQRPVGWTICLALLIGIAVLRIASTYHVFNATIDEASHIPPVLTRTWFHTGAYIDGDRISRQFEREYYREPGLTDEQAHDLP